MKILELKLTAFGPFHGQRLDLSAGNHGLHVVFGGNEAGKSSALRALQALLYGIPGQTPDAFLHPYPLLRVGGRLRNSSGTEISFVRRKGNKNTLLDDDGLRLDDRALDRYLGGESAEKFHTFWGIDYARLVEGGRELLAGRGDLADSLFAAGSGVAGLRNLRKTLEEEAKELYAPRAQKPAINQGIHDVKTQRRTQGEATLSAEEWSRRERVLRDAKERVAKLSDREQHLEREQAQLTRVKRVLPLLAEREALRERLARVADARVLAENFSERRQKAEEALRTASKALERTRGQRDEQKAAFERLGKPSTLLAEAEVLDKLHLDLGRHRAARSHRPKLEGERREKRAEAEKRLHEVLPDLDLDAAARLRVFVGRRDRIRKLATERARLDERLAATHRDREKASEQKKLLEHSATELPPERDTEHLQNAITATRRGGDAEDERDQAAQEVKRLAKLRAAHSERLGLSASVADHLEELRVPRTEAIEGFVSSRNTLEDDTRATSTERQRLERELRALNTKIETLHAKKSVPTEEQLAAARSRRDQAFDLLREHWEKGHDVTEKARQLLGTGELIDLFPNAIKLADDIADHLRAAAEHVTKLAQYMEDRRLRESEIEPAKAQTARQEEQEAKIDAEWRTLWQPVVSSPPSIDAARSWRSDFERLREQSLDLATAREQLQRHNGWIEKQVESLRTAIAALEPGRRLPTGLDAILVVGEQLLKRIESEQRKRQDHAAQRQKNHQDLLDAEKTARDARAEIADWGHSWTEATRGLLPEETAPIDDVLLAIDTVEQALRALEEASGYQTRIKGIDRDAEKFRNDAVALAQRLGETIAAGDEEPWVETVHKRLADARTEEERIRNAKDRLAHLQTQTERDHEAMHDAEDALAALCAEAGCAAVGELSEIEERSAERQTCAGEIERIERELVRSGDGSSIERLAAEATGVDHDTLGVRLGKIERDLGELATQLPEARNAQANAQAQLDQCKGPSVASEKAEEVQGTLAKLRDDVLRYARLRVASKLLERRIDDYRRHNQAPLLHRAGEHFRKMTQRGFEGLEADKEDDSPILTGIRPNRERVPAHGMSEGTRDQLFLALRLAAVEASCKDSEPLPFIVDDVLVQFYDERTNACLKVLADVAEQTQIVLFTHHLHVRKAAEAIGGQVIVHNL